MAHPSSNSDEMEVGGKQVDTLSVFKKDKNVLKFMRKYRYQYHVTMLPDLAELVRNAYQEGYWNGLRQYPMTPEPNAPVGNLEGDLGSSHMQGTPKAQGHEADNLSAESAGE